MMEPITTTIVSVIALGAANGLKPIVEQGIKDAYEGLKRLIVDRYRDKTDVVDAVDFVSKNPQAEKRRAVLEEALAEAGAHQDATLLEAAKAVHVAVEKQAPDLPQSIGMDIGTRKAAVLEAENVQAAAGGIGVKIGTAEIAGTATFKNIGGGSRPNA